MAIPINKQLEIMTNLTRKYTRNARWASFVDFTRHADAHRLFLYDIHGQKLYYEGYTSHGSGSGAHPGNNLVFSNVPNSHKSSDGLIRTGSTYFSLKFRSIALRLHGMEPGINDNIYERAIVIHKGKYVTREYVKQHGYPGRSRGCITIDPEFNSDIINRMKGGSIMFIASRYSLERLNTLL